MKKRGLIKSLVALAMVVTAAPVSNVNAVTTTNTAVGDYEAAIAEIKYDRKEADGKITPVAVSKALKETIDQRVKMGRDYKSPVQGTVDGNQLKLNVQLVNVYLDNAEYKNGASPAGESFFDLLEFYADVLQVKQLMDDSTYGQYEFVDNKGKSVDKEYVESLLELLKDVYNLDPTTNLVYRQASIKGEKGYNEKDLYAGADVIATSDDGKATFTFHMDHHGFWGYELAGDTFMDSVIDIPRSKERSIRSLNEEYGNFMKIKLPELEGKTGKFNWYMLNDTDLENPYMYVGTDSKGNNDALLVDVDMYGKNVINDVIKAAIAETYGDVDKLDTLYIYLTHQHLDHVNNLAVINEDAQLRDKVKLIWPAAEKHATLNGRDLVTLFDYADAKGTTPRESRVINLSDGDELTILDHTFKLLSLPGQHTDGGSGLADINMGIYYSGDTLGSQIHLGGTSINVSKPELSQGWLDSMGKTVDFMKEHGLRYIMTGHSPYPIQKDYASWMGEAIEYIDEQLKTNPTFSGTVVVENGKVVNGTARYGEMFANGLTDKEVFEVASVNFGNRYKPGASTEVTGDYEAAIAEIRYDRKEADGSVTEVPVTDSLKETIDQRVEMGKDYKSPVNAVVDPATLTIKVDVALADVYLDNAEYKNGASPAGESFFNLLEFYADVLQVKTIAEGYSRYTIVDATGAKVSVAYVNSLADLIEKVYNLDPTTDLEYRQASIEGEEGFNPDDLYGGADVIARGENGATFTFHMDHHGFWGYELAGDTFMDDVIGIARSEERGIRELNEEYGNFMKIKLPELEGKTGDFDWYMLNDTDLENPYIYVGTGIGTDGKKHNDALLIDVDMYGKNVINDVIKAAIAETYGDVDKLDTLYIYLTHQHLDHVNNLAVINEDAQLRDKVKLIWPAAEKHATLNGRDLVTLFDYEDAEGTISRESRVINLSDGDELTILGHKFKLLSLPGQHTDGGSGLADVTMGIYYSGDTLGSQIHLGGTSIFSMNGALSQGWLDSMGKTVDFMKEHGLRYIMTGHSPYPLNKDYASWMGEAIEYINEQLKTNPTFSGTVVVENGKVINGTDRHGEIFANGLTDKEVFDFASVNFMNFFRPEEKPEEPDNPTVNPDDPTTPDTPDTPTTPEKGDKVDTGDYTNAGLWVAVAAVALTGAVVVIKRRKEEA